MSKLELSGETCTTRQAAEALGVALRTAQLWTESGRLRAWKTEGGHRRILVASVKELWNARDSWSPISANDTEPRRHETVPTHSVGEIDVSAAEVEMKQQPNGELHLLLRLNLRPV